VNINKIDISRFQQNSSFYNRLQFLLTVKSFDLAAIRKRYIKSRKNNTSERVGSVERRKVTEGGIVQLEIDNGSVKNHQILARVPEPRGVDSHKGKIALSSENKVYIISGNEVKEFSDPWFSYIHTVNFERSGQNALLVSSSGYDAIFEYDLDTLSKNYEWFAWENGFSHGLDPKTGKKFYLTRRKDVYQQHKSQGEECIYINDPDSQVLPTAKRAAFINSVVYDSINEQEIIATFFHEGAVYSINKETNQAVLKLDGLKSPHGGQRSAGGFIGTSTASGMVVNGNIENKIMYLFHSLPGKPDSLGDLEWLQNSIVVDNNIITIDSNRNSFVIFNPEKKLIDIVPFDPNWAIQDMIISDPSHAQLSLIKEIGNR